MEGYYVKITQDGIGRLSFGETPGQVLGLCTDGLVTCHGIIFHGERGVVLIHNTGRISNNRLVNELEWVGTLNFCVVVFCFEPGTGTAYEETTHYMESFNQLMADRGVTQVQYLQSKDGCVSVRRNPDETGAWFSILPLLPEINCRPPIFARLRLTSNIINNILNSGDLRVFGDVQFDGYGMTNPLLLNFPLETLRAMIRQTLEEANVEEQNVASAVSQADNYFTFLENYSSEMNM